MKIVAGILALMAPLPVFAHGGNPAEAKITVPSDVGIVADDEFVITWIDSDRAIPTGTATVDLFYTQERPPTFFLGDIPDLLTGTSLAAGIREVDPTNRFRWDTSAVSAGTYWIWSIVHEPPEPMASPIYISFSPAPLHVQHAGDPVGPSVRITRPATDISFADEGFEIGFRAFAPNGPATIRLEAGTTLDGSNFTVIADGLAATSTGSFWWVTSDLEEADWTVRAVITDRTGSFTAYSPYFLLVTHFFPLRDAGRNDADTAQAVDSGSLDAEPAPSPREDRGCSCNTEGSPGAPWMILPVLMLKRRHLPRLTVPKDTRR